MTQTPRLELTGLNKRFGDTQVLYDVDLTISGGEIHGLAGQNGSGKSTVIKILTGVYVPDSGAQLRVDGTPMRLPVRWPEVHSAGISVVHQDLGILDELSVAENVCVGGFPRSRWFGHINRRRRDEICSDTLARVGATVAPSTLTSDLTAAERAEVAIARALRDHKPGQGLVILDEATRALSGTELERIHDLLRRITAEGSSVLMISHNLVELADLADRVTVLRDGHVVAGALSMSEAGPEEIARHMLGGASRLARPARKDRTAEAVAAPTAARLTGLRSERLREVDFSVGAGEIVGITGLPGSGYEDIPYLLTGARKATAGTLETRDAQIDLTRTKPRDSIRAGVVLIPERRDRDGLAVDIGVRDNICLPALRQHGRRGFLSRGWQQEAFLHYTKTLEMKTAGPMSLVRQLSGGNQQKALLAKWLSVNPQVLVLHEPTQAVDVGARQDILATMQRIADEGTGIVLVSSEAEDLIALCNRILIYDPSAGLTPARGVTVDALIEEIYRSTEAPRGASSEA